MNLSLDFYRRFSGLPRPKSYLGKFLLVAFLGVHVPLIALVVFTALQASTWSVALPVLLVALVATLVGTAATLIVQSWLLAPLIHTARALDEYRRTRKLPNLPTDFTDEAGVLMNNAQGCVTQLEALLGLKNDLLAVISHDTRHPMAQIITASQLMEFEVSQGKNNPAQIQKFNGIIQRAGQRQLKLMDDLMKLARSEREAIALTENKVSPLNLLNTVEENCRLQAERKNICLEVEDLAAGTSSGEALPALRLDLAKTTQVLNNLTHNAIKFTPEGGTVTLRAARVEMRDGEPLLALTVQDTGTGMDEGTRKGLFVPFNKAGRAGTNGEESSGLGLWICKTFTEAQGGDLGVQSEPGKGSAFTVHLPWREAGAEADEPVRLPTITAGGGLLSARGTLTAA